MQIPTELKPHSAVIDGLKFETKKSDLVAFSEDDPFSGQKFLFRTAQGRYFLQSQNDPNGPKLSVESVSTFQAKEFWNTCENANKLAFGAAFPELRRKVRAA